MTRTTVEINELRHRLVFAERQFEQFKLRVIQAQLKAQLALTLNDAKQAERELSYARNHLDHCNECNEVIDELRRQTDRLL